jgi:hypothetical protein
MSLRFFAPAPQDLRDAMAVLSDPARHRGHPAVIQSNWLLLKQARGQSVDLTVIGPPAHRMACAAPPWVEPSRRPPIPAPTRPVISRLVSALFPDGDAA